MKFRFDGKVTGWMPYTQYVVGSSFIPAYNRQWYAYSVGLLESEFPHTNASAVRILEEDYIISLASCYLMEHV